MATDFQHRKGLQNDKMWGHKALALKIDWHCKLPGKIQVCTRKGKSFAPFKSAMSIHLEDTTTTFWKCHPCSEGINTASVDLERLNLRLNIIQGRGLKVIHVNKLLQCSAEVMKHFRGRGVSVTRHLSLDETLG